MISLHFLRQGLSPLHLTNKLSLHFLAPSDQEVLGFIMRNKSRDFDQSRLLNLFSSVVKLKIEGEGYILFTSDVEKKVFSYVYHSFLAGIDPDELPLLLAQIPHHGSEKNFDSRMLEYLVRKKQPKSQGFVISCGEKMHQMYHGKLPNPEICVALKAQTYPVSMTASFKYRSIGKAIKVAQAQGDLDLASTSRSDEVRTLKPSVNKKMLQSRRELEPVSEFSAYKKQDHFFTFHV